MDERFDTIVIGSSFAALGFLLSAKPESLGRCALITSTEVAPQFLSTKVHAKTSPFGVNIVEPTRHGIYGCHNFGGLSAAWGGILSVVNETTLQQAFNHEMAGKISRNYADCIRAISAFFPLYCVSDNSKQLMDPKGLDTSAKLADAYVVGSESKDAWDNCGLSVEPLVHEICESKGIEIHEGRVTSLSFDDAVVIATLEHQHTIVAGKCVLAIGIANTLDLLAPVMAPDTTVEIYDHTPLQILGFGTSLGTMTETKGSPIELVKIEGDWTASIYSVSALSKKTLRASGIGGWILSFLPSKIADHLFIVQIWSNAAIQCVGKKPKHRSLLSEIHKAMIFFKDSHRFKPTIYKTTTAGLGFHYLAPRLSCSGTFKPLSSFIKDKCLESQLYVVGAAMSNVPFAEHPTLTIMAHGYSIGENF